MIGNQSSRRGEFYVEYEQFIKVTTLGYKVIRILTDKTRIHRRTHQRMLNQKNIIVSSIWSIPLYFVNVWRVSVAYASRAS